MRLLRAADVPLTERDRVFRYSRARTILFLVALAGAAGALAWLGVRRHSMLALYLLAVTVVGAILLRRLVLARFRASNWLVRLGDAGLFIQFRSYLNHHYRADDPTVVFLGLGEVRSARLVRQRRIVPSRDESTGDRGGSTEHRLRYVELQVDGDAAPLARALAEERARKPPMERRWYGSIGTQYRHEPVRLESPTTLRLEWKVSPGPGALFELLESHARIEAPLDETRDLTQSADRDQQERNLTELARAGHVVEAIALARRLHGCDLTRAKQLVDRLHGAADDEGSSAA